MPDCYVLLCDTAYQGSDELIKAYKSYPTKAQLVKALVDLGFHSGFIASNVDTFFNTGCLDCIGLRWHIEGITLIDSEE